MDIQWLKKASREKGFPIQDVSLSPCWKMTGPYTSVRGK
ncbi:hypothetical protein [Polycladomyces subterraneus]